MENTSDREVLVETEVSADGLALDWVHKIVYYTDTKSSAIKMLSWDAKHQKTIVNQEVSHPRAIVVSPEKGSVQFKIENENLKS